MLSQLDLEPTTMEAEALQWRSPRTRLLYPLLGTLSLLAILYLNFSDNPIPFPRLLLSQPKMGFVATDSTRFVVDDGDGRSNPTALYVNGWNSYWLMEESVWESSRSKVSRMLKMGAQMGLTVCRTWAFSDGPASDSLQTSPGVFNHRVFQGLDYVIVEARKNRVRLIFSLVNNLNAFGGKAQYVRWAQDAGVNVSSSDDSFFTHPTIKDYYKAWVKAVVTRKNSISGIKYSEEPAIFAWELMNEPRCTSDSCSHALQNDSFALDASCNPAIGRDLGGFSGDMAWISEMAAYIKTLDPKHLVTVGLEGFYGLNTTEKSRVNPGEWASLLGSDFLENSATYNIDFASVHAYPDSWIPEADMEAKVKYLSQWVDSHINDGDYKLKKPILFTEIGSALNLKKEGTYDRDVFFKTVYDRIFESAKKRQAGAGALIWQLLVEDMEQQYSDEFSFIAWDHPSTYKLIKEQSCRISKQMNGTLRHNHDPCFGL